MAIRTILPADEKAISNLFRQLYPNDAEAEIDVDLTAASFEAEYFPFCVEEGGQVVGLIIGTTVKYGAEKIGYVDELVVEESMRGHGIGAKLMEHLLNQFESKGVQVVFVAISDSTETGPLGFYRKLGFQECRNPWLFSSFRNLA